MPRKPVKPFIDKKNAESFIVVHRSLQDPLTHDESASPMVLLSASSRMAVPEFHGQRPHGPRSGRGEDGDEAGADGAASVAASRATRRSARTTGGGAGGAEGDAVSVARSSRSANTMRSVRGAPEVRRVGGMLELREVDESGLPLDGYDYARHLAVGGGGLFISADGSMHRGGGSVAGGSVAGGSVTGGSVARGGGASVGGASRMSRSTRGGPGAAAAAMGRAGASVAGDDERNDTRNDEMLDGLYDTHDAAAALRLPRGVLPSLPEDLWETLSAVEGSGGRAGGALDALTLVEESMPLDLKELMEAIEEADAEGSEDDEGGEEDTADADAAAAKAAAKAAAAAAAALAGAPRVGTRAPVVVRGAVVEALDDCFVLQAMGRLPIPEVEGGNVDAQASAESGPAGAPAAGAEFDFDAHVARLMERAEGMLVDCDALDDISEGDEDAAGEGEEEWDEEDEEGEEGGEGEDSEEGEEGSGEEGDEALASGAGEGRGASAAAPRPSDAAMAAMLARYDDAEIGELHEDDPRVKHDGFEWQARMAAALEAAEPVSEAGAAAAAAAAARVRPGRIVLPGANSGGALLTLASAHLARRAESAGAVYSDAAKEAVAAMRARAEEDRLARKAAWAAGAGERAAAAAAAEAAAAGDGAVGIAEALAAAAAAAAARAAAASQAAAASAVTAAATAPTADAPPPAAAAAKPSAAFGLNLAAFGKKAAPAAPAPVAAPPATAPPPPAAAAAASESDDESNGDDDNDVDAPPQLDAAEGPAAVPFGCADGDMALDALDFIPPAWTKPKYRAEHDAETIVSTYSNALHHPSRLGDAPASVVAASRGNAATRLRLGVRGDDASSVVSGSGTSHTVGGDASLASTVRCSHKTGLPVGVALVVQGGNAPAGAPAVALALVRREEPPPATIEEGDEEGGSGASQSGSGDEAAGDEGVRVPAGAARPRGETPDERRARKGAVRAERGARREAKKALKLAYKAATVSLAALPRDPLAGGIAL